ncbi:MAG: T9SS type A sorting domain-containing protein, partial [Bacteroidales bacterium]|nr:T9SS type A sorting domain-containing protein [Bacteroidales bacterium]
IQDSIRLTVKEPRKDYSYWWESWDENWTFLPMNNGTQAILRFTGEAQQGIIVLYATNGFDTVYTPYKVVRCNKTCSYDTTQGIYISRAKCLKPGDIAVFSIKPDPDAISYTWEFGGGWISETSTITDPYDTVVRVVVGDAPGWAKVTGENCSGEWHMETEESIPVVTYEAQLAHYDGCVNIGLPDTLLLRVENIEEGISYQWDLPKNWIPVGCDTCGEITVAVQEPLDTVRTYGVKTDNTNGCVSIWKEDTVSIKGADTVLLIVNFEDIDMYVVMSEDFGLLDENVFVYLWYKTALSPNNFVDSFEMVAKYLFKGEPPVLAYRYNEGCWSVTDEVINYDDIEFSLFDTKRKTTNEETDAEQDISIIPNPTTNQTLLRWDGDMDRIEIISESGQRVLTYNVAGLQQKIVDMSNMPAGVYFVRFLVENSVVATKKLIKR